MVKGWCYCKHNDATGEYVQKDGFEWFKCDCGMLTRFAEIKPEFFDDIDHFVNNHKTDEAVQEAGRKLTISTPIPFKKGKK